MFIVKLLQVQVILNCDKQTLLDILKALAQQAKLPDLTTEIMLNFLEEICTNSELLHYLQELLLQPTEALSINL